MTSIDREKEVFIPWKNEYLVGIPIIDEQHKILIELANDLYDSCRDGRSSAADGFRRAVHAVVNYVKVHFSTEEKIMERVNFPEALEHRNEHKEFVQQVLLEVKNFESGKRFAYYGFLNYLRDWTLNHIAHTDRFMVDYVLKLAKQGLLNHHNP